MFLNRFVLTEKVGEDSQTIEEVVQNLLERWMEVNHIMDERHKKVNALLEINRIHSESDAMTRVLETHHKWLQSAEESIINSEDLPKLLDQSKVCLILSEQTKTFFSNLLIFFKLRLKSMLSQKEKVQKITEDILKLCAETPSLTTDSNVNDIKSFISYWEETNKKIISFDNRLKEKSIENSSQSVLKLTQSPIFDESSEAPQELRKAIKGLSECLDKTNKSIDFDSMQTISDSNALEKQLKKFEELIKTVCSEEINLKYINHCSKEIFDSEDSSKEWVQSLSKTVDLLNVKWDSVNDKIKSRIDLISKSLQTINSLEEEIISLDKWMDDVNVFLKEDIAIGDLETLEQQLEQCNKLQKDIKITIQSSIDNVNKNAVEITKNFNFKNTTKFQEINQKWEKLKNATIDKNNKLQTIFQNSNAIHEMLTQTEEWVTKAESDIQSSTQLIGTDFNSNLNKLKSILSGITSKKREIKSIKDKLDEINLNQMTTGSFEELKHRYTSIEKSLEKYENTVNESIDRVKKSQTISGEMRRLVMNETDWLDKLAKKLKRSPQLAADAEEISECLDVSLDFVFMSIDTDLSFQLF